MYDCSTLNLSFCKSYTFKMLLLELLYWLTFSVSSSWSEMSFYVCVLSHIQFFATPWTVAFQAVHEFSRQEYWSGRTQCHFLLQVLLQSWYGESITHQMSYSPNDGSFNHFGSFFLQALAIFIFGVYRYKFSGQKYAKEFGC